MVNPQLLEIIKQQTQKGVSREQITSVLLEDKTKNWQTNDIDAVFDFLIVPSVVPIQTITSTPAPVAIEKIPAFSPNASAKKSNNVLLIAGLIIGSLLIASGGAFAYVNYFQSPERIIQKMMANMANVKSTEYSGEIKIETDMAGLKNANGGMLPVSDKATSNFTVNFSGASDIQNINDPKGVFTVNIKTDALGQDESDFGFELRTISKIVYLNINNLPSLGAFDLSSLKNQWIKIDTEALKEKLAAASDKAGDSSEKKVGGEATPEQIEKIKIVLQQANIFKITEKLASEKIEGMNTYHYKFMIDKVALRNVFVEISKIIADKTPTEEELATADENLAKIELPEGEIWIGKNDLLPYKFSMNYTMKDVEKGKTSGKASLSVLYKNFNKPVQIDIPEPVKTVEEILGGLFSQLQPSAKTTPINPSLSSGAQPVSSVDTDMDGLPDEAEIIYGTNPNKDDTDGDGYSDGTEVKGGYDPKVAGK